jgi:hypothetical protein
VVVRKEYILVLTFQMTVSLNILVLDEWHILECFRDLLHETTEGTVSCAGTVDDAREFAAKEKYDILLVEPYVFLEGRVPQPDGRSRASAEDLRDWMAEMRGHGVRVVMCTTQREDIGPYETWGFSRGRTHDAYVRKPAGIREIVAAMDLHQ